MERSSIFRFIVGNSESLYQPVWINCLRICACHVQVWHNAFRDRPPEFDVNKNVGINSVDRRRLLSGIVPQFSFVQDFHRSFSLSGWGWPADRNGDEVSSSSSSSVDDDEDEDVLVRDNGNENEDTGREVFFDVFTAFRNDNEWLPDAPPAPHTSSNDDDVDGNSIDDWNNYNPGTTVDVGAEIIVSDMGRRSSEEMRQLQQQQQQQQHPPPITTPQLQSHLRSQHQHQNHDVESSATATQKEEEEEEVTLTKKEVEKSDHERKKVLRVKLKTETRPVILWGSHHKTGTYLAQKIFSLLCARMHWCCLFHVTRWVSLSHLHTQNIHTYTHSLSHSLSFHPRPLCCRPCCFLCLMLCCYCCVVYVLCFFLSCCQRVDGSSATGEAGRRPLSDWSQSVGVVPRRAGSALPLRAFLQAPLQEDRVGLQVYCVVFV